MNYDLSCTGIPEDIENMRYWNQLEHITIGCQNKKYSPIELLVLGALRYLGRGWTFYDLEESTAVSLEVHRCFFHVFIDYGSTVLFERYVSAPKTFAEAKHHMHEFTAAGFNGCVASTDCTHITSEKIEYNLRNNHLGGKSDKTIRTFSLNAVECRNERYWNEIP